jgi:hypothetical protein
VRTRSKVLSLIGAILSAASSFYVFVDTEWIKTAMFTLFCVMMATAAIIMVIALLKIRACFVDKGLGEQVTPFKMVVHSMAFLVYMISYIVLAFIDSN